MLRNFRPKRAPILSAVRSSDYQLKGHRVACSYFAPLGSAWEDSRCAQRSHWRILVDLVHPSHRRPSNTGRCSISSKGHESFSRLFWWRSSQDHSTSEIRHCTKYLTYLTANARHARHGDAGTPGRNTACCSAMNRSPINTAISPPWLRAS